MIDIEAELREQLRAAADQAPRFDPGPLLDELAGTDDHVPERAIDPLEDDDPEREGHPRAGAVGESAPTMITAGPTTRRRSGWRIPVGIAAGLLIIIGIGTVVVRQLINTNTGSSSVSCAAVLTFRGRQYESVEAVRIPKPGKDLGTATTCSDTVDNGTPAPPDRVQIVAASGISPEWAFLYDGQLWVADRQDDPPAAIGQLQQPIRCRSGVGKLSGTVTRLDGRPVDESPPTAAPYTMTLRVTGSPLASFQAQRYQAVMVQIHVTDDTAGANLVGRIADEPDASVTARVRCSGKTFRAQRIQLG